MIPERRTQTPFRYPRHAPRCPSKVRSRSAHAYPVSPPGAAAPDACHPGVKEWQGSVSPGRKTPAGEGSPWGPPFPPAMLLPLL